MNLRLSWKSLKRIIKSLNLKPGTVTPTSNPREVRAEGLLHIWGHPGVPGHPGLYSKTPTPQTNKQKTHLLTPTIQNVPVKVLSQSLLEFQIKICYACFPWWNLGQSATALAAMKTRWNVPAGEPERERGTALSVKAQKRPSVRPLQSLLKFWPPWKSTSCHYKQSECPVLRGSNKPQWTLPSPTL